MEGVGFLILALPMVGILHVAAHLLGILRRQDVRRTASRRVLTSSCEAHLLRNLESYWPRDPRISSIGRSVR